MFMLYKNNKGRKATPTRATEREIVRKPNKVVGCVWGIGERK
jgi:hypothetical protein